MNSRSNTGTNEHARDLFAVASMIALFCATPSLGQAPNARQTAGAHTGNRKTTAVPANTLEVIRKQAATARQRAIDMGKMEAAGELDKATNEATSVKEKAERMAAQMAGREGSTSEGPQADLLRRQAAARAEQLQKEGSLRAALKEQESAEKAAEIQRQSESLQEELTNNEDDQHRGIKLNPIGTNLYIRNYSIVKPNIKPLQAQQQSLSTNDAAGRVTSHSVAGNQAASRSTGASLKHVTADVKGRLLPK